MFQSENSATKRLNMAHPLQDPMRDANRSRAFIDLQRELKNSPETSTSLSAAKAGVAQSTTARLKDLLAGYRSITDIPLNHLGPELYAAYPDAKYIVSLRPGGAKEWFRSFYSTVSLCYRRDWSRKRWAFLIWPVSWMTNMDHMVREAYHRMERDCGGVIDETCYDKHTEMVKKFIPEEQLLVFNLTDGWEPLCDFLDVPVPDQPFPKLNDAKQMQALFVGMQIYGAMVYTLFLGFFGVGVTAFFKPHLLPGMIRHRLPSFFSS